MPGGVALDIERLRTLLPNLIHQAEDNDHRFKGQPTPWKYDVDSSQGKSRIVAVCSQCNARIEVETDTLNVFWDDSAALVFPCLWRLHQERPGQ